MPNKTIAKTSRPPEPTQERSPMAKHEHNNGVRINVAPMILTTVVCTAACVAGGYFLFKKLEERKEKAEADKLKEQEERNAAMPPMPMMFGGLGVGGTKPNDESKRLMEKLNDALERQNQYESRLDTVMNRITDWEHALSAREHHLRLVSGGEDYDEED